MKPSIEIIEPKLFSGTVADEIVASIAEFVAETGRCTIALAGGSTPGAVYRDLARPPRVQEVEWPKVKLFLGDERWVPSDDVQSNLKMVRETLLVNLPSPGPQVFPVNTTLPNAEAGAKDYERQISSAFSLKTAELPRFDLVLLGIGEDGHTASLFPGSPLLAESGGICSPATKPEDKSVRVSLSAATLFSAKKVFFIAKGEGKSSMMRRVIEGNEPIEQIPARLYQRATGAVTFFLDSGAGRELEVAKGRA